MSIFRRPKDEVKVTDPRELDRVTQMLEAYNAKEVELFIIMGKAAESLPSGPYGRAIDLYAAKVKEQIKVMEREIIQEGQSLITRHLLDDVAEDEYVESMEMTKEKLRLLRNVQAYVDFITNREVIRNNDNPRMLRVEEK